MDKNQKLWSQIIPECVVYVMETFRSKCSPVVVVQVEKLFWHLFDMFNMKTFRLEVKSLKKTMFASIKTL